MKQFMKISFVVLALFCLVGSRVTNAAPAKVSNTQPKAQVMPKPQEGPSPLSGKIAETFSSGGYTYLLIENKGGGTWAAVPEIKAKAGQQITLQPGNEMTNFKSKTLNRTFDRIIFSAGPVNQQPTGQQSKTSAETLTSHSSAKGPVPTVTAEKIKVSKASGPNAYTVVDLFAKRATLNNKSVVVRGKVVKVSANIMGKTWIHLQDGTGNSKDGSNDLVVTSQDLPALGEVVTASGTLYKDKDFGAGYKYAVIVENASVKK